MKSPCILTIAGSDSGGGAGIQADIKTICMLGGFGLTAITVLTAQNSLEVTGVYAPKPSFIMLQLETLFKDFPIKAVKLGMLYSKDIISAVKTILLEKDIPIVVDPVCTSQTGQILLQAEALAALCREIIPLATILTPNKPEAEYLTNRSLSTTEDIKAVGQQFLNMGAKSVLIKGGHFIPTSTNCIDWFLEANKPLIPLKQPFIKTKHTHGTGCTLSAAIATFLGFGLSKKEAIIKAQQYLNHCLKFSHAHGAGYGTPHHLSWLTKEV